MGISRFLRQFGGWSTVQRWSEPVWCRVWIKGDGLARLLLALAVGALMTAILLGLFAINVNPPHPLFALFGMLIFGGLAFMLLFQGESTASGKFVCVKKASAASDSTWACQRSGRKMQAGPGNSCSAASSSKEKISASRFRSCCSTRARMLS